MLFREHKLMNRVTTLSRKVLKEYARISPGLISFGFLFKLESIDFAVRSFHVCETREICQFPGHEQI